MISNNTDKEWEKLGKDQPYFGVISDTSYAQENLNSDAIRKFFDTGEEYISMIFRHISAHIHPEFKPRHTLDFGCGCGRLVIPLASRSGQVTGIDVSASMLKEAEKNCEERKVRNADFHPCLESLVPGRTFDFINTFIVLQHIPTFKGRAIFKTLVERLAPGGCGAIHMTYHDGSSRFSAILVVLRKKVQLINVLFKLIKGLPLTAPFMQMNAYDMNYIQWELQKSGCMEFHSLFTNHGGHGGQILLFRKPLTRLPLKA